MATNIGTQLAVVIEKTQQTVFMVQSLGRIGVHLASSVDYLDFVNLVEYFGNLQAEQFDELIALVSRDGKEVSHAS